MKALTKVLDIQKPINVVLSGGGVKGVAHIAFLEKIKELGFTIGAISGCSSGALVGTLYAMGMSVPEMLTFFKSTPLFKISYISPMKRGIFDTMKYAEVIKKYVPLTFEDLRIPLVIGATNLQKGRIEYFSTGDLRPPLLASCAVPALFSPVEIDGELYTDGGVMDNFPILPFVNSNTAVIGSYVCRPDEKSKKELNTIIKVTDHCNGLLLYAASQPKFKATDHTVVFPIGKYNTFDTKQIDNIYKEAKTYLDQI